MDVLLIDLAPLLSFHGGLHWTVGFLTTVAIFAIVALGLNLQWGYTGVFNFGVVAFFMVGAYTSALLTLPPPDPGFEDYLGGWSLPVPVGWLAAMGAAGLLALVIGLPTLRLRRDFLAIATIGIAAILRSVANSVEGLVNRARGLNGVPRFLDELATGEDYRWVMLGIALVMLVLVYLVVSRLTGSPWGRVLRAIRENEDTARASGKDTVSFRMQSFVLGGMIMGLGGAIFAHRVNAIAPTSFTDLFGTFLVWTMLMVGGSGNNRGAVLGALVVGFFWFGVPLLQEDLPDFLGDRVFMIRQLVIGLLIVAFLLRRPAGLLPEERRISRFVDELRTESVASRLWRRLRGRAPQPDPPG
jgi:branched-chain amino acid transport system permease protein